MSSCQSLALNSQLNDTLSFAYLSEILKTSEHYIHTG